MRPEVVLMNFTHVYEEERFVRNRRFSWIDCTDLDGTDCYCDSEACRVLEQRIAPYHSDCIHFIDSGNYHYMTKLWTDRLDYPFSLVVFDHHPDMQPTLFDDMLSCGSWVKEMLDSNPELKHVVIAGASDDLIGKVLPGYRDRVKFYSERELSQEDGWARFSSGHVDTPVYISVDKDVLDTASAVTNWDQGSLSLPELESLLSAILRKEQIIGVDICGECSRSLDYFEESRELEMDGKANSELLSLFLRQK